jgi:hypothetical protein
MNTRDSAQAMVLQCYMGLRQALDDNKSFSEDELINIREQFIQYKEAAKSWLDLNQVTLEERQALESMENYLKLLPVFTLNFPEDRPKDKANANYQKFIDTLNKFHQEYILTSYYEKQAKKHLEGLSSEDISNLFKFIEKKENALPLKKIDANDSQFSEKYKEIYAFLNREPKREDKRLLKDALLAELNRRKKYSLETIPTDVANIIASYTEKTSGLFFPLSKSFSKKIPLKFEIFQKENLPLFNAAINLILDKDAKNRDRDLSILLREVPALVLFRDDAIVKERKIKNTSLLECAYVKLDLDLIATIKRCFFLFKDGRDELENQLAKYRPDIAKLRVVSQEEKPYRPDIAKLRVVTQEQKSLLEALFAPDIKYQIGDICLLVELKPMSDYYVAFTSQYHFMRDGKEINWGGTLKRNQHTELVRAMDEHDTLSVIKILDSVSKLSPEVKVKLQEEFDKDNNKQQLKRS